MPEKPRILAFAGSLRAASYNKMLAKIGVEAARAAGAEVTYIDLLDFPMPILNQDDELAHGLPENAKKLKQLFISHHGFLISSPEYNSSMSAALKNAIDWASREETEDEPSLIAYTGKTCALMSASPGALGGLRALVHVRSMLGNIGVHVIPDQVSVPKAHEAFNPDGSLKDERKQKSVAALAGKLVEVTRKLSL
ncbi:MAG: NAD(P)H-dependent oxidoreductase [Verrucomicrobiota bacterium]